MRSLCWGKIDEIRCSYSQLLSLRPETQGWPALSGGKNGGKLCRRPPEAGGAPRTVNARAVRAPQVAAPWPANRWSRPQAPGPDGRAPACARKSRVCPTNGTRETVGRRGMWRGPRGGPWHARKRGRKRGLIRRLSQVWDTCVPLVGHLMGFGLTHETECPSFWDTSPERVTLTVSLVRPTLARRRGRETRLTVSLARLTCISLAQAKRKVNHHVPRFGGQHPRVCRAPRA